jgi:hypothetical protein
MSPGRPDAALVRRHLLALGEVLQALRRHQGVLVHDIWTSTSTRSSICSARGSTTS